MSVADFYTDLLLPILKTACAVVPVLGQSVGYPTSIQKAPWLCHIFDGMQSETQGQLTFLRYTTIHRLHVQWQAFEAAEMQLITLSNALFQALEGRSKESLLPIPANPTYVGGLFTLAPLTTGFVTVSSVVYRVADVRSTLGIKVSQPYWS